MSAESPNPIPAPELAVARAVARRLGRPVYAIQTDAGRRLAPEPPEDVTTVAYAVEARGPVHWGPAGRPSPPAAGASLVRDAAGVPADELALARDVALALGETVFVADGAPGSDERLRVLTAPPDDGTLRWAVRPTGALLVGDEALAEPPRRIRDATWATRAGSALRALRRLRERGEALAEVRTVSPRDWGRVERLVPAAEREALHPRTVVGAPGAEVARRVLDAADRELGRWRAEAGRLFPA